MDYILVTRIYQPRYEDTFVYRVALSALSPETRAKLKPVCHSVVHVSSLCHVYEHAFPLDFETLNEIVNTKAMNDKYEDVENTNVIFVNDADTRPFMHIVYLDYFD